MAKRVPPVPGAFFEARYPFIRDTFTSFDGEGPCEESTWRPGTRGEARGSEDATMVADAIGTIILTVVSVHKPGRFPTRVFFTRRWRDPQGREFGKGALRCATASQFHRLANGYRHEYEMSRDLSALPHKAADR